MCECVHVHACVFVAYFAAALAEACCLFTSVRPPPPWSTSKLVPLFTLPCTILEYKAAQVQQEVAPESEDHRGGVSESSVRPRVEGMGQETAVETTKSPQTTNLVCHPDILTSPRISTISSQPAHLLTQSVTYRMLFLGPGSGGFCYLKSLWILYRFHKVAMFISPAPAT